MSIVPSISEDAVFSEMGNSGDDVKSAKDHANILHDLRSTFERRILELKVKKDKEPLTEEDNDLYKQYEVNLKAINEQLAALDGQVASNYIGQAKNILSKFKPKVIAPVEGASIIKITEIKGDKKMSEDKPKEANQDSQANADNKYLMPASQSIPQGPASATTGDSTKPSGNTESDNKPAVEAPTAQPTDTPAPATETPAPEAEKPTEIEATPRTPGLIPPQTKASPKVGEVPKKEKEAEEPAAKEPEEGSSPPKPTPKPVPQTFPGGKAPSLEGEPEKAEDKPVEAPAVPEVTPMEAPKEANLQMANAEPVSEIDPSLSITGRIQSTVSSIKKLHYGAVSSMTDKPSTKELNMPQRIVRGPTMHQENMPGAGSGFSPIHESVAEKAKIILEKFGPDKKVAEASAYKAMREMLEAFYRDNAR